MAKIIDTLLLVALPASGKSEVRTYLSSLSPAECRESFHLGETVQLDDFPYVHLMRRIDEELGSLAVDSLFFGAQDQPFKDGVEWGTLIALLNEDHADLHTRRVVEPESAATHLFDRLERARLSVGGPAKLSRLDDSIYRVLAERLESEAAALLADKHANYPDSLEGKTIVIEFARGGPQNAPLPLPAPYGYGYSFACLSPEILERSSILYIWVTPEESRRKNEARADPDDPGSILHHGVPLAVMLNEYGCDDIEYLLGQSGEADAVAVEAHGKRFSLPLARFDNRVDKTSFVREARDQWPAASVQALHAGLKQALDKLGSRL